MVACGLLAFAAAAFAGSTITGVIDHCQGTLGGIITPAGVAINFLRAPMPVGKRAANAIPADPGLIDAEAQGSETLQVAWGYPPSQKITGELDDVWVRALIGTADEDDDCEDAWSAA